MKLPRFCIVCEQRIGEDGSFYVAQAAFAIDDVQVGASLSVVHDHCREEVGDEGVQQIMLREFQEQVRHARYMEEMKPPDDTYLN